MNYFTRLGDKLVVRLINYGILLHVSFCIGAFSMIILAPFVVSDFYDDVKLADELLNRPTTITAPLVNRSREGWNSDSGKFLYYLDLPISHTNIGRDYGVSGMPFYRYIEVDYLNSLEIYDHPRLADSPFHLQKVVEVPSEQNWSSVFKAIRGRSFAAAITVLMLQFVLAVFVFYVAIRGYYFIKHGRRKRRY